MNALAVSDSLSNRNEHVEALALLIGSGQKRDIFDLIYRSQKRAWTIAEISEELGIASKRVSELAGKLAAGHALLRDEAGGKLIYRKVPQHKGIKDQILRVAGNSKAIAAIPTKRRPAINGSLFVAPKSVKTYRRSGSQHPKITGSTRVVFMMASPAGSTAINVGMDFREAKKAVLASKGRDKMQFEAFPAADVNDLLDALNEFRPQIVHFSGHGDSDLVLFDTDGVKEVGGSVLQFDVAKRMLSATSSPPTCLVLAACQTANGADTFLDVIPVVIAMSGNVSDFAAAFFCRRFYAALAAGQSISDSFAQAKAYLAAEQLEDADLPELLVRPESAAHLKPLVS